MRSFLSVAIPVDLSFVLEFFISFPYISPRCTIVANIADGDSFVSINRKSFSYLRGGMRFTLELDDVQTSGRPGSTMCENKDAMLCLEQCVIVVKATNPNLFHKHPQTLV